MTQKINSDAPHQVAILIQYEILERDELGRNIKPVEMGASTFPINGNSFPETQAKLVSFLNKVKELYEKEYQS